MTGFELPSGSVSYARLVTAIDLVLDGWAFARKPPLSALGSSCKALVFPFALLMVLYVNFFALVCCYFELLKVRCSLFQSNLPAIELTLSASTRMSLMPIDRFTKEPCDSFTVPYKRDVLFIHAFYYYCTALAQNAVPFVWMRS